MPVSGIVLLPCWSEAIDKAAYTTITETISKAKESYYSIAPALLINPHTTLKKEFAADEVPVM